MFQASHWHKVTQGEAVPQASEAQNGQITLDISGAEKSCRML